MPKVPELCAAHYVLDFGYVSKGLNKSRKIKFTNISTQPVRAGPVCLPCPPTLPHRCGSGASGGGGEEGGGEERGPLPKHISCLVMCSAAQSDSKARLMARWWGASNPALCHPSPRHNCPHKHPPCRRCCTTAQVAFGLDKYLLETWGVGVGDPANIKLAGAPDCGSQDLQLTIMGGRWGARGLGEGGRAAWRRSRVWAGWLGAALWWRQVSAGCVDLHLLRAGAGVLGAACAAGWCGQRMLAAAAGQRGS